MKWSAIAAAIWATYATMLGFIGGRTFEDNHTKAFIVAFSMAIGATVILEVIRYVRGKKSSSRHD
jgi:membrane protein DedA with SNARE-associated domain